MFIAPAGNPSSLRVGHPDVATEHTGLSPASLSLLPMVRGRVRLCGRERTAGPRLGKSVRGGGEGNAGVRHRRQLTGEQDRYLGAVVSPYGRLGHLPEGSRQEGSSATMRARSTAIPS